MVKTVVESKTKTAVLGFDQPFCVIGERINPTGRKKLAAELEAGDYSTVEKDALAQVMAGADILDINAGVVYNSNPNPNETKRAPLTQEYFNMGRTPTRSSLINPTISQRTNQNPSPPTLPPQTPHRLPKPDP